MIQYEELLEKLFSFADESYRVFHKRILKNESINIIGVRTPILRKLSKSYLNCAESLFSFPDDYYEVTFLKCATAAHFPYDLFLKYVDILVPLLNNWATCDCFGAECIIKHRENFLPYIEKYFSSEAEFSRRFALVTLLRYYMHEDYLNLIFSYLQRCNFRQYYVETAASWLLAEALIQFYERTIQFIEEGNLQPIILNRGIQKARESLRLQKERKEELLNYKVVESPKRVDKNSEIR